jgi:putative ABC transport system permease protein
MKIAATLTIALRALARNKMRSLLTTLGIVIGVTAVILMQAMGAGAAARVGAEISSLGSNMLIVLPGGQDHGAFNGSMRSAPTFTRADLDAIRSDCPDVHRAAAVSSRSMRVVAGERNYTTSLVGTTADYFDIRDWHAVLGRDLEDDDIRQSTKTCVIGHTVVTELFAGEDPLGAELRLHDMTCSVVGVLATKGVSTFGQDQDNVVVLPHTTFARRITGDQHIGMIMVSAVSEAATDAAKSEIEGLLRQRRRILRDEADDFNVRDLREIQQVLGAVTGVLTALLAGVAAISLVVGGIGIMNIMLVSVTERTREIGVRRAIGARAGDILQQFIVEAVVLAAIGGLLGVLLGVAGAFLASRVLDVPLILSATGGLVAFAVSVVIGIVFGAFPARKASRLRPIEALRFE